MLVTAHTLDSLTPGSVCVDLGSSSRGGNVAGSVELSTVVTPGGVVVIGAGELAADLPGSASQMYGRNVAAALASLAPHDAITIDPADEIHSSIVVAHDGAVSNLAVRAALGLAPAPLDIVPAKANAS
jgi:NAD(P) transhydrogenase subunit alpha